MEHQELGGEDLETVPHATEIMHPTRNAPRVTVRPPKALSASFSDILSGKLGDGRSREPPEFIESESSHLKNDEWPIIIDRCN